MLASTTVLRGVRRQALQGLARAASGHSRGMASSAEPHGGKLVNLMADESAGRDAAARADAKLELSDRNACDVELLINGGFSPLEGFMNRDAYESVVEKHRLPNNLLFGLPVVLDTDRDDLVPGKKVLLQYKGEDVAVLDVEDRYVPDKVKETHKCYGTTELAHPGTMMVALERGNTYLGGKLTGLKLPSRDIPCQTPAEVRAMLPEGKPIVAFQCRNPIHRAHFELFTRSAAGIPDNTVLVHPTVGPTQDDDIPGDVRYKTYVTLQEHELAGAKGEHVKFAYLPYSMHMAGPREALQHMMIRKNYGCTHFIIGRDMAGSKSSITGEDYYGPYDAQEFASSVAEELGVATVPSLNLVYTAEEGYMTADKAAEKGLKPVKLSGTEFRRRLRAGEEIPEWFAFPSVVDVLRANV